jgi:hypothetical protein
MPQNKMAPPESPRKLDPGRSCQSDSVQQSIWPCSCSLRNSHAAHPVRIATFPIAKSARSYQAAEFLVHPPVGSSHETFGGRAAHCANLATRMGRACRLRLPPRPRRHHPCPRCRPPEVSLFGARNSRRASGHDERQGRVGGGAGRRHEGPRPVGPPPPGEERDPPEGGD